MNIFKHPLRWPMLAVVVTVCGAAPVTLALARQAAPDAGLADTGAVATAPSEPESEPAAQPAPDGDMTSGGMTSQAGPGPGSGFSPAPPPSEESGPWADDQPIDLSSQEESTASGAEPSEAAASAAEPIVQGFVVTPRRPRVAGLSDAPGSPADLEARIAADQALIAREPRRERPIDPAKLRQLAALSRVLGALHALRVSCDGRSDQTYRSRMATLLDLEVPGSGSARAPLVSAFNAGFSSGGRGAAPCPDASRTQEAALARQGRELALSLAAQYRATLVRSTAPRGAPDGPAATETDVRQATDVR